MFGASPFLLYGLAEHIVLQRAAVDHIPVALGAITQSGKVFRHRHAGDTRELFHHGKLVALSLQAEALQHGSRELERRGCGKDHQRGVVGACRLVLLRHVPGNSRVRIAQIMMLAPDAADGSPGTCVVAALPARLR